MKKIIAGLCILGFLSLLFACKDSFLEPKPLSFLSITNTYNTIQGLQSGLNSCRKGLVKDFMLEGGYLQIDYVGTDLAVAVNGGVHNYNTQMLPSTASIANQWNSAYTQIKNANAILAGAMKMDISSQAVQRIIGEVYFFRGYWYYRLINLYGDVPLVLEEVNEPKLDFVSSTRNRIIKQMIKDLEIAESYLSDDIQDGEVSKAAVQHLLTKYYLQDSRFQDAVTMSSKIIDNPRYELMKNRFGVAKDDETKNVMWDLFNKANISLPENKEKIMVILNRYNVVGSSGNSARNREFVSAWFNTINDSQGKRGTVDGISGEPQITFTGRGIGKSKKTNYYRFTLWNDNNDLRHAYPACWIPIDSLIYNNPESIDYGKKIKQETCTDTLKGFDDMFVNKILVEDEALPKYVGANIIGGCTDWYVFRLAETYLLRAEAYVWIGGADNLSKAAADINEVRKRAGAKPAGNEIGLDDVLDERARELYVEEFRRTELVRIAYIMASKSINGYTLDNMGEKNFFYDRVIDKNNFYKENYEYKKVPYLLSPFHVYWPIPESAIEANTKAVINQNYGYVGYEKNIEPIDE
ncbi:RagB/SusD family nutrient uptake outer membrane protein [Bacteroides uniformis]|nr:RagB/SusD family nutrient uptake outer membrane protein [Bacteroides uniformis]